MKVRSAGSNLVHEGEVVYIKGAKMVRRICSGSTLKLSGQVRVRGSGQPVQMGGKWVNLRMCDKCVKALESAGNV